MRHLLPLLILLSSRPIFSKLINSNNVSLTTELIPHTEEPRTVNPHRNPNFYLKSSDAQELEEQADSGQPILSAAQAAPQNQDIAKHGSEALHTQLTNKRVGMVCPFRMRTSVTKILKHSYNALKLVLVPSKLDNSVKSVCLASTTGGLLGTFSLLFFAYSDAVFEELRKRWAFQGELDKGTVEGYTRLGVAVLGTDLLFRVVVLRLAMLKSLEDSNFLSNVNWMGTNLGKVDRSLFYKGFSSFAHSLMLTKMAVMTVLHYLLMKSNWNTASFIMDASLTKTLAKFFMVVFSVSLFGRLVETAYFRSLSNFTDLEHLLEPLEYRANQVKFSAFKELMDFFHHLPKPLQKVLDGKRRFFLKLLNLREASKMLSPPELEWISVYLNAAISMHSNSAAGLYLVGIQYLAAVLSDILTLVEKGALKGTLKL